MKTIMFSIVGMCLSTLFLITGCVFTERNLIGNAYSTNRGYPREIIYFDTCDRFLYEMSTGVSTFKYSSGTWEIISRKSRIAIHSDYSPRKIDYSVTELNLTDKPILEVIVTDDDDNNLCYPFCEVILNNDLNLQYRLSYLGNSVINIEDKISLNEILILIPGSIDSLSYNLKYKITTPDIDKLVFKTANVPPIGYEAINDTIIIGLGRINFKGKRYKKMDEDWLQKWLINK